MHSQATGSREQRQAEILRRIVAGETADVGTLASQFEVAEMTIRRDLAALAAAGKVDRIHGGARAVRAPVFERRAGERETEKRAIADAVSLRIPGGQTVGIDIGTTCLAVAEVLAQRDDLVIVTYSIPVASAFRSSACRAILLGGVLTEELSLVNGNILDIRQNVHLDTLVLGCAGYSGTQGISYFDPAEVEVRRALVQATDEVVLAADYTKFAARAAFTLGPADLVSHIVTDTRAILDDVPSAVGVTRATR
ncbi:hypothetical protein DEJ27_08410 [Curtobacterium sp. MCPF17_018]|uniref:DeoR/GlpR family DNA-binding transcription regulator n=1 Tax=Curtobacterium sp. MCPF17_018 TaxID=2175638 RepID=UPI000DAAD215|nr:DeoR/GlpR family DNA-binding transcription regulator [Curtobacterium sp. MCPF17_018]PZE69296.1 hypothetical protein DEJ27_08410 [Curtobacterium sp. MCPF17_018]